MKFSKFFVDRPIFAAVLSLVIVVAGALALCSCRSANTRGGAADSRRARRVSRGQTRRSSPKRWRRHSSSRSTASRTCSNVLAGDLRWPAELTITFALGTDLDNAQVQVQNRVAQALPRLPSEVQRIGVMTEKATPDFIMVVHLVSPNDRYDQLYLSNFAKLHVKDELARIAGVGSVQVFGAGEYSMRVWLDPNRLASRQLTTTDVVRAIREQNVQVAAGVLGAQPAPVGHDLPAVGQHAWPADDRGANSPTSSSGRLLTDRSPACATSDGSSWARIGTRSAACSITSRRSRSASSSGQAPMPSRRRTEVRQTMERLKQDFPEGVDYKIVYDPTVFVRNSITAVVETLFEAILLVVIVVMVFLQTWRASVIPLVAVPVSLIGTFAVMLAMGFSLNTLSLFGLVLSIGIVVDDAIVVVENVERHIELGLPPLEATRKAMDEVSGPIIAIALVLCAVFVPTAFVSGLTGQFYRQFALTIAISTVISAFNSLTLSPALASRLLRPHEASRDIVQRAIDRLFGWFFRAVQPALHAWLEWLRRRRVGVCCASSAVAIVLYVGLIGLTTAGFARVPPGFVPTQDKEYLVAFAQLPDGASLDRTDAVIRKMSSIALEHPGVVNSIAFPGLSINGFVNAPNAGIVFVALKPSDERARIRISPLTPSSATLISSSRRSRKPSSRYSRRRRSRDSGTVGGFKLYVEDRAGLGFEELYAQVQARIGEGAAEPSLAGLFSSFQVNVPQIDGDVDRERAKTYGVPLTDVFETLQVYLGSLYVNDFNRFGRTYQVNVQAESPSACSQSRSAGSRRATPPARWCRSARWSGRTGYGPDQVMHYNGYPAAEINGGPAPGYSSGQAQAAIADAARAHAAARHDLRVDGAGLPGAISGNTMLFVFPLCVLLVYIVLAAQYRAGRCRSAVILIVPMTLLSAIAGVWVTGGDNNVFTQISFLVLAGLACKNAILIVEFARQREEEGATASTAISRRAASVCARS